MDYRGPIRISRSTRHALGRLGRPVGCCWPRRRSPRRVWDRRWSAALSGWR